MSEEKKKPRPLLSDRFGMIVDEDRCAMLHITIQTAFLTNPLFEASIQSKGLGRCLEEFMIELSEKEHALGWCKDPNCTLKNGPNEE